MKDSTLYSRWLKKELSEAEIAQLKSSGDLEILEKIIAETDSWDLPPLKEGAYDRLQNKLISIKKGETKVIPLKQTNFGAYGIAASVVMVLISAYFIFFADHTTTYQCLAGQKLTINLPDATVITLNGQSNIRIDEDDFLKNRKVKLTGEGYFEVTKKGDFKVEFTQGQVHVLGTRFTILSGKELATIKCYEGIVRVANAANEETTLTAGKGVRLNLGQAETFEIYGNNPDWLHGESIFKDVPLKEVLTALSIQYNASFEFNGVDLNRNYSGKFTHKDLKAALDMVLTPMNIQYTLKNPEKDQPTVVLE